MPVGQRTSTLGKQLLVGAQLTQKMLEDQVRELDQTLALKSGEIKSLVDRKERFERVLCSDEESMKKMIEDKLIALKLEKPELFYMTQAEQIGQLGALILKRLLS
jgi:hypothetical protein